MADTILLRDHNQPCDDPIHKQKLSYRGLWALRDAHWVITDRKTGEVEGVSTVHPPNDIQRNMYQYSLCPGGRLVEATVRYECETHESTINKSADQCHKVAGWNELSRRTADPCVKVRRVAADWPEDAALGGNE